MPNTPVAEPPIELGENLLANPGFERSNLFSATGWEGRGRFKWVRSGARTGLGAARLRGAAVVSAVSTTCFAIPENSRVEVGAWLSAVQVPKDGLRLSLSAYGADARTRIRHWDLTSIGGSFAWREFKGTFIAPPETTCMSLSAQHDAPSGESYVDDAYAAIVQTVPEPDRESVPHPIIVPAPAEASAIRGYLRIDSGELVVQTEDEDLEVWTLREVLASGIPLMEPSSMSRSPVHHIKVFVGQAGDANIEASFERAFPQRTWSDIGSQGYFLSVEATPDGGAVYLGAHTDTGRFYGLQTLKQIIDTRGDSPTIASIDVLDAPAIERRGVMVPIQWYVRRDLTFERMASLKMNFAWNQGSFVNEKFRFAWREPLTSREKEDVADYLERASEAHVDAFLSISPKGEEPIDPPIFSSERDIRAVVSKMEVLYELGARNLGLSFDDQSNYRLDRLYGDDVTVFDNDIGAAHAYFIREVFGRIASRHPDVEFMVVPMTYSGVINMSDESVMYLRSLAALPSEIGFFTAVEYPEEARIVNALTGRTHVMMDNFWARHYREPAPEYVLPLDRPRELTLDLISGYAFLPMPPGVDDEAGVSWSSAAEYAWRGNEYTPEAAFQRAAWRHLDTSTVSVGQ